MIIGMFAGLVFGIGLGIILGMRNQTKVWKDNAYSLGPIDDYKVVTTKFFDKKMRQNYKNHIRGAHRE